jgi:hypothetical protein
LVADDAQLFVTIIKDFLPNLSVMTNRFQLIPVRAVMCTGIRRFKVGPSIQVLKNFQFLPYIGEAFVKSYKIEKIGCKGMRFFITDSVRKALSSQQTVHISPQPLGQVTVKYEVPEDYFEVNWFDSMVLSHQIGIPGGIGTTTIEVEASKLAKNWITYGNLYQKEVAQSILDLMDWARTATYHSPPMRKISLWERLLKCLRPVL